MEVKFLKEALFSGMTANAFRLGTTLTLGWFWPRTTSCSIFFRSAAMELIDSAQVLAVADKNANTITPPDYLPHNNNETYFYLVRRVNCCGYLEHTTAAAVKLSLDSGGELVKPQPNKIFNLQAAQVYGNKIHLLWYYCPVGQKSAPARFLIYCDHGSGQINYESPVAAINYQGRRFYSYLSESLDKAGYLFVIRAENTSGTENSSLANFKIQLNTINPNTIDILHIKAI